MGGKLYAHMWAGSFGVQKKVLLWLLELEDTYSELPIMGVKNESGVL